MPSLEPFVADSPGEPGSYWNRARTDIVSAAMRLGEAHRVLDVGCGSGWIGETLLRHGLASEVVGIEMNRAVAELARDRLTEVIAGDANGYLMRPGSPFDGAILADVLEHQVDPDALLDLVLARVRPGGYVIISLPNVRHVRVILNLAFRGDWTYVDEGILDRTHLRFFTEQSATEMVECRGLDLRFVLGTMTKRGRAVARIGKFIAPFLATQIVLGCRVPD
jgi:2-polyprenyl-3-methyl-5-hydroxy-6-metoxy-1,4-benzoquinol methylase